MLQLRYADWRAFSRIRKGDINLSGKRKKNKKSDHKKKQRKLARQKTQWSPPKRSPVQLDKEPNHGEEAI